VSIDLLCALCEVATGSMIWPGGSRGNGATKNW
jgi:hypothetical protein